MKEINLLEIVIIIIVLISIAIRFLQAVIEKVRAQSAQHRPEIDKSAEPVPPFFPGSRSVSIPQSSKASADLGWSDALKTDVSLFNDDEIADLYARSSLRTIHFKQYRFIKCIVYNRDIQIDDERGFQHEEIIRQLYAKRLIKQYGYSRNRLAFEYPVNFGTREGRADIVVFDKDHPDSPYIIVELKRPNREEGKEQLYSYCNATGAPIGVWTNGEQISYYYRKDPNYFEEISDIPNSEQSLEDIHQEKTLKSLVSPLQEEGVLPKLSQRRLKLKKLRYALQSKSTIRQGVIMREFLQRPRAFDI